MHDRHNIQQDIYSDIDLELKENLLTKDIIKKRNLDDIKQSIINLLQTTYYSRLWHPEIGSYFPKVVFMPLDMTSREIILKEINSLMNKYEPRIKIENIEIGNEDTFDSYFSSEIKIRITFYAIDINKKEVLTWVVNRTR